MQIEEQHPALLVAELGPVDAFQAPQGRPDQPASVAGADRQPYRAGGVVLGVLGLVPVGRDHHGAR